MIQQNRAFSALQIGCETPIPGFHIFVVGPPGTGRRTLTQRYVSQIARLRRVPPDICYVYNFENADEPLVLLLPPGKGNELHEAISSFRKLLVEQLPKVFESADYEETRSRIQQELKKEQDEAWEKLQSRAKALGFVILATPKGLQPVPIWQGKPLTPEIAATLPDETREHLRKQESIVVDFIQEFLKIQRDLQKKYSEKLKEYETQLVQHFIQPILEEVKQTFREHIKVIEWIETLQRDVMDNLRSIFESIRHIQEHGPKHPTILDRYDVNLMVSHRNTKGCPVVYEPNPTFYNLFGRIDRKPYEGTFITDYMHIKPGALHKANGGFLIIEALELLRYPLAWETLKRSLLRRELFIEDYGQQFSPIPVATLRPQPLPLDLKVILIGPPWVYEILFHVDEDFQKIFKIRAEFQATMPRNQETAGDVLRFIARVCFEENLKHLTRDGVEEILLYSHRLAGDKDELSAAFGIIAEIIREAHYWALKWEKQYVDREVIQHTIQQRRFRHSYLEERVQKAIERDVLFIDVDGKKCGQINGLAVYQYGGFAFGKPSRITASIGAGQDGIIHIERQVKLSGPIHDKGVLILSGYLRSLFARDKPLSLSASITFEQAYEGIEGDSASLAELLVLLSALSGVPLLQSIAVTGSVNQHGVVQPVGGINHKIEGFFKTCKMKGLTGRQGVLIPKANIRHLCLDDEVIEAVRKGEFHIWAVETVPEAISLLFEITAGSWNEKEKKWEPESSVFALVNKRFVELAKARKFLDAKERSQDKGNENKD